MEPKRTLYQRLTNKLLINIRNEENFALKTSISANYAKIIVFLFLFFVIVFSISLYLAGVVLSSWNIEQNAERSLRRKVIELAVKVDSLDLEVQKKDLYIANINNIINGSDPEKLLQTRNEDNAKPTVKPFELVDSTELLIVDKKLRKEFEMGKDNISFVSETPSASSGKLSEIHFFTPMRGLVSSEFNPKIGHYGVDIVSKKDEPIKAAEDGTVVLASWTYDGGYTIGVQHKNNLFSFYKHNSQLLKKVGSFVKKGEVIAIVGNTGEYSTGPHLHFELWHEGLALDPANFIRF